MSYSHACIRYLCLLEPTLTVPAILDRAYPSLTGLEEVRLDPSPTAFSPLFSFDLVPRLFVPRLTELRPS